MTASFDEISQDWLIRFLQHRIGDKRIIRLIQKWLKAGILEDGIVTESDRGTGQGSVISPLLANIYLHYALDLWAARWRRREATGDMMVVRYADDFIIGFEHESDAARFLEAMRERLGKFALTLHPEKTRLIEFGRCAAQRRARRGLGKPATFDFLGFTFICGKTRAGQFQIKRKSRRDRMAAKLKVIKAEMCKRRHQPIPQQGHWLAQVVRGYFNYHAVPTNGRALDTFRHHVSELWRRTLRRRSQKDRLTWERMTQLAAAWLPTSRILHPWPSVRFAVNRPRGNLTGVTSLGADLGPKRLGLLHELVPTGTVIAVLVDQNFPDGVSQLMGLQEAARSVNRQIIALNVRTASDIDTAFATLVQQHAGALTSLGGNFFNTRNEQIVTLAARYAIPAIYDRREFPAAGGLMSYGPDRREVTRQAGIYVARILKGDKPGDLPVQQPTKFEFIINLRTARALKLNIPPGILAIPDEVIE